MNHLYDIRECPFFIRLSSVQLKQFLFYEGVSLQGTVIFSHGQNKFLRTNQFDFYQRGPFTPLTSYNYTN